MITSLYAGLLALMFLGLSVNVIKSRRQFRIALGDDNLHELKRKIRAQANFSEYTVLFLLLLGYVEHNGLTPYGVYSLGTVFLIGRVLHAYSLLKAEKYVDGTITAMPVWRASGMLCTLGSIGLLSLILILQYIAA